MSRYLCCGVGLRNDESTRVCVFVLMIKNVGREVVAGS